MDRWLWRAYFLSLKAEALHFADRTSEALEILDEALALVEASGARCWSAQFYRLRGVFLTRLGADEAQIEEAFCRAIRTAKEQKSISLDEARRSDLRRISQAKSECDKRRWIPTTYLLTIRAFESL